MSVLLLYRERGWTATFDADDLVSYADEGISGEEIMRDCALWMADASQNNEVVLGQLRTTVRVSIIALAMEVVLLLANVAVK